MNRVTNSRTSTSNKALSEAFAKKYTATLTATVEKMIATMTRTRTTNTRRSSFFAMELCISFSTRSFVEEAASDSSSPGKDPDNEAPSSHSIANVSPMGLEILDSLFASITFSWKRWNEELNFLCEVVRLLFIDQPLALVRMKSASFLPVRSTWKYFLGLDQSFS
jgi:hypothetical protein